MDVEIDEEGEQNWKVDNDEKYNFLYIKKMRDIKIIKN